MLSFLLNPWMLLGALGLAIPIMIEILFRRRRRRIELPSIRYLLKNPEQKKIKQQDRLLLLLRCLFPVLLALCLARPSVSPDLVGAARPRHVMLLLDGTISMGQQAGVSSAFALAKNKAAALVRILPQNARVTLISLGHRPEVEMHRSDDLYAVKERIEGLRISHGAASMGEAAAVLKQLLDAHPEPGETQELYVFSDFQKSTWLKRSAGGGDPVAEVRSLEELAEVSLVDVGGSRQFNYYLSDLAPAELPLAADRTVNFRCTIEARGTAPSNATQARVTLVVNDEKKGMQEFELASGNKTLTFPFRFPAPGTYLIEAVVEGDFHSIDNRRFYLATVPEAHKVLIVDERAGGLESRYLRAGIEPRSQPGLDRISAFAAKIVSPPEVVRESLAEYCAVLVLGMERPPQDLINKLEPYARNGGNAIFFLNGKLNIFEYNQRLYRKGEGLLPFELDKPLSSGEGGLRLKPSGDPHPVLHQTSFGPADAKGEVLQYMRPASMPAATKVLATFSNESPALTESKFGNGRVIAFCTSAGPPESFLPLNPEYPVLLQRLLSYLVGNPDGEANLQTGEAFEEEVMAGSQHVIVRKPDQSKVRIAPEATAAGLPRMRFDKTDQMGRYEVNTEGNVVKHPAFVVNLRAEEGDLDRMDEGELTGLLSRSSWIHAGSAIENVVKRKYSRIELSGGLLWIVVAMVTLEALLAMRFGMRRG